MTGESKINLTIAGAGVLLSLCVALVAVAQATGEIKQTSQNNKDELERRHDAVYSVPVIRQKVETIAGDTTENKQTIKNVDSNITQLKDNFHRFELEQERRYGQIDRKLDQILRNGH